MALDVKALLHRKVGKVPVVLIAGAVLAVGALVYYRHKSSMPAATDTPTDTTTAGTTPEDGLAAFTDLGGSESTGLAGGGGSIVTTPVTTPVADTNDAWSQRAIAYLIAQKLATPGDAQSAIVTYLSGGNLTYAQGQLRDEAITGVGLPPESLGSIGSTGEAPAQRQFTNFPGVHTVKGSSDNTFTELSNLYYAGKSGGIPLLQEHNIPLGTAGPFNVGTKVNIPSWVDPQFYTAVTSTRSLAAIASKNGISQAELTALNVNLQFPVAVGTKVRVK